jgi:valyl-tRNA synthetase
LRSKESLKIFASIYAILTEEIWRQQLELKKKPLYINWPEMKPFNAALIADFENNGDNF